MSGADDYVTPEGKARRRIDEMLELAGWKVQDYHSVNLGAGKGVALRELPTNAGPTDYALYVNRQLVGVIEAKKEGTTLSGVEPQTLKYQRNVPESLAAFRVDGLLPFGYESTGTETYFTCRIDPVPTARRVFWFHTPEALERQVEDHDRHGRGSLRARIPMIPALEPNPSWLRDAQAAAIRNLEESLKDNEPRALIQMATGSGKTFCAANISQRLLDHAGAQRILFLVDRANLGRQTLKEFQGFDVPGTGRKFTELYNVQPLAGNGVDSVASVCVGTIQRVYSMLRGQPLSEDADEVTGFELPAEREVPPLGYQPRLPIDAFDVIIVDECHRSIYGVWRQVLEYFDAFLIGLTATPGKQTLGFFNQNLVMEYGFADAVADGVNVDFDVFRISTEITEQGSTIDAGYVVKFRDRETRAERLERVDEDLSYPAAELDKRATSPDQIRTLLRTLRHNLPAMFPDRQLDDRGRLKHIPKTLIFAKDDHHAEEIVRIARDVFGQGNDAIAKITYRSSDGNKPEDLLQAFRNSYHPRIAVTVDMIATGTDVKPLEIVMFMRMVRSRNYFEQMKGRGVRTIDADSLKRVTEDATMKDRFVLVDAVGVTETQLIESTPLERKRGTPLKQLLQQAAIGHVSEDLVSSLASRLARLNNRIGPEGRQRLEEVAGESLRAVAHRLADAIDPDRHLDAARAATGSDDPDDEAIAAAKARILQEAVLPLDNPEFRQQLLDVQRNLEMIIDEISQDRVTKAMFAVDAKARALQTVESFKAFIEEHKDEITALQVLYSRPYRKRLTYRDIKELAEAIGRPPHRWTAERLWEAYETLDASKVRGSPGRVLTNIVSLVRYAVGDEDELVPFPDEVHERFEGWLAQQDQAGRGFTPDQLEWLRLICDHLAASLSIEPRELMEPPFSGRGGLGRARQLFGDDLDALLAELTDVVAA